MASLNYKPTRMELSNLKRRKLVAERGHKMMKDKRDEMVRRFIGYVRRNKELREEVETKLAQAMKSFVLARAMMSDAQIEEALMYPARSAQISVEKQYILGLEMPRIEMQADEKTNLPYGFVTTSAELDAAVQALGELLPLLMELAEAERVAKRLADEIEKTRRRVNALEHVMIPQFTEAIRKIRMKLDENERGNQTRLMKTKEMLAKQTD